MPLPQIVMTAQFKKAVKKLHANQKADLDAAVRAVAEEPDLGEMKTGDLAGVQVYKFKMVGQMVLMAYVYQDAILTLTLLALGPHENFYRDLKR
jgi:mRNA-degrading endonuclease RelE of RelBE toxin-antitoxin system